MTNLDRMLALETIRKYEYEIESRKEIRRCAGTQRVADLQTAKIKALQTKVRELKRICSID